MTPTLALLLKAPRPGQVKTRLAASVGETEAAAIYRQLVERQLRALPPSWPATVHYDPPEALDEMRGWLCPSHPGLGFSPQAKGDLGARLTDAFAREFTRGATSVIALGGDCPELDGVILQSAQRALHAADVVLGPALDGGYYLIGLNAPRAGLFTDITWSTPTVLAQTRTKIRELGLTGVELPVLEDVDDAPSWARALTKWPQST